VVLGALAAGGVLAGVAAANALPERALQVGFAALMVLVAGQLVRRVLAGSRSPAADR
jgi:uncharacterized membrane protein YfcA